VRYQVVGVTTLAAILLYLDRVCLAEIAKLDEFKQSIGLTEKQTGFVLSAFFLSYALSQMPAGWLSDRFGARQMLPLYIVIWSLCTMLTGLANGFLLLIAARLVFGIAQAGCYPTASSLLRRWIPQERRGTASSIVSFGGRFGGAIAPFLTVWLLAYSLSWRWVLVLYGLIGLGVAAYFWFVFRDQPEEHPKVDEDELKLIQGNQNEAPVNGATALTSAALDATKATRSPLLQLVSSKSLWLMCTVQFGINVGWVFLVTWLPKYLKDVKQVDPKIGGLMSSIVLTAGIAGILCGGQLTDFLTRKLGRQWGRKLPMILCYSTAVVAYISCLYLDSVWAFIAAASLVAFATDMSVPAIWACMQDIGGNKTATVFGWGNMWGNLGAALIPVAVPFVRDHWDTNGDWHELFVIFSLGYLLAALATLGINANQRIE
jgi:sugar phosphate permease